MTKEKFHSEIQAIQEILRNEVVRLNGYRDIQGNLYRIIEITHIEKRIRFLEELKNENFTLTE